MSAAETEEFEPAIFLAEDDIPDNSLNPSALLILNQPIHSFAVFSRLWKRANYRICADGGANRLYDMFSGELEAQRSGYLPNAIHGDLDSLRDDVRAYYASHGVEVSRDCNQQNTDFCKTMQKISTENATTSHQEVLVLGTLAGRVDHCFGLLHEMIVEENRNPNLRLWLFSESSLSFILKSPRNVIRGTLASGLFTEVVGLLPIYGTAHITTSGLEWDVQNWETRMGGEISTSNYVRAEEVHVETDAPILFTIERSPLA